MKNLMLALGALALLGVGSAHAGDVDGEKIFKKKCAMCHKVDKKKMGPALKDMNPDVDVLKQTVIQGRKMMPAFGKKLSAEEIDAVVAFIASKNPNAKSANPCAMH